MPTYLLILMCFSGMSSLSSSTNLTISLVNKATPVFTQLFYDDVEISEEAEPHSVVTSSVKASSPLSDQVYYTIESGDELNLFDIDFKKGTSFMICCSCDASFNKPLFFH